MKIKDKYDLVIGSFRLMDSHALDVILDERGRVLIDTGLSYNVDHVITRCLSTSSLVDICSKFGVDHINRFDEKFKKHLTFLGKDHLEYALIHFYEEGWEELASLLIDYMGKGLIKHVGVSNFNITQIKEFFDKFGFYPTVNQIECSVRYHDPELIKFCHEHDIEVMAYGVLGGIHASKQYVREYTVEYLLWFVANHLGAVPILRSDNTEHLDHLATVYDCLRKRYLDVSEFDASVVKEFSYTLNSEVKDDRALNKFRYDKPKHVVLYNAAGESFVSIDSRVSEYVTPSKVLKIDSLDHQSLIDMGYTPIDRSYMMITDYLLDIKYFTENHKVRVAYDDLIVMIGPQYKYKAFSVVMLDESNSMIKSGSCKASVYVKTIHL